VTTVSLSLANRIEELPRLADAVAAFAAAHGLSPRDTLHLDLVLEEAVSNSIKYGYEPGDDHDAAVRVDLAHGAGRVTIRISDDGLPFDPLADAPDPDTQAGLEDRPIGGLGVHMMKTVMTDLRYTRDGGRNVLDMALILNRPS